MASRVVSLVLSAWILLSAYALPRSPTQVALLLTTGLSAVAAALLAFFVGWARLVNVVNGAALVILAVLVPSASDVTVQNDIIAPGLLLVVSALTSSHCRRGEGRRR